jgi:dihydrodipicolinate synthase/N-acetylneuraminate lyase
MRSEALTKADYARSVVAVAPMALNADLSINAEANKALIRHIEAGGVNILLYGGNANFYHIDLGRFREMLALLAANTASGTGVVPSIGPDFGKMIDQAPILRESPIRDAMVLPTQFPADPAGIERGVREVVQKLGFGIVLYVKRENYIEADRLAKMVQGGDVRFVKYAVERPEAAGDAYLSSLCSAIGADMIDSGMGETPLHAHLGAEYKLAGYTSGGVCIAPAASMALLQAYKSGNTAEAERIRQPFLEFERVRARFGGISVLHAAVTLSGIADMGPILPLLSNVPDTNHGEVRRVVEGLQSIEAEFTSARRAA